MFTVFTIGHSNHPMERFLELLVAAPDRAAGRHSPLPRFAEASAFQSRESRRVARCGRTSDYEWIEELGGRRKASAGSASPNQGLRNESFRNYADYMLTPEFQQGIDKLLALAARRPTAIMCAEGLWWQCHRRLVSDYLLANGLAVEHIFPNGQTKPHVLTPEARTAAGRVTYPASNTLFGADESNPCRAGTKRAPRRSLIAGQRHDSASSCPPGTPTCRSPCQRSGRCLRAGPAAFPSRWREKRTVWHRRSKSEFPPRRGRHARGTVRALKLGDLLVGDRFRAGAAPRAGRRSGRCSPCPAPRQNRQTA